MAPKYDKTSSLHVSREQEGSYHRRKVESTKPTGNNYTTESYEVVPVSGGRTALHQRSDDEGQASDAGQHDEWTTSRRKVNHKTRQVETRVSRQLVMEDGRVIADSGPQVTTRIKEDNKVEECEREKAPKNKAKFAALPACDASGRVLSEKKEIQRVSREVREENMQYHDERLKELTGHDVHRKALQSPQELITLREADAGGPARGKMVHYSNKGKKYQDTDEILEVAKLAEDGSITKEVKRTRHHEECSEDERPDELGEAEQLRKEPTVTRSSRRHVDYVNDLDDTSVGSSQEWSDDDAGVRQSRPSAARSSSRRNHAFPRYQMDPLLNSLKDEDFRPLERQQPSGAGYREHRLQRRERSSSSASSSSSEAEKEAHADERRRRGLVSPAPATRGAVEIPEEYRVNRERLGAGRKPAGSQLSAGRARERSFSPAARSQLSQRSHARSHKEDASVQAHLTEEEEERKSLASSSSDAQRQHEKLTRKLQRQSTQGSRRNYYYGQQHRQQHRPQSPASVRIARSSSSCATSSSSSDEDEDAGAGAKYRKEGVQSRDSGFKSPTAAARTGTPLSPGSGHQIYSVSSKAKSRHSGGQRPLPARDGATSPGAASLGQRSVKTTTTTLSAGLQDRRPGDEPDERRAHPKAAGQRQRGSGKQRANRSFNPPPPQPPTPPPLFAAEKRTLGLDARPTASLEPEQLPVELASCRSSHKKNWKQRQQEVPPKPVSESKCDSISVASMQSHLSTTIKVPYRRERMLDGDEQYYLDQHDEYAKSPFVEPLTEARSELSFQEDIQHLRERLDNINNSGSSLSIAHKRPIGEQSHFNYKTIIKNLQPNLANGSHPFGQPHKVDTYNVTVIEHNSPFRQDKMPLNSVNDLYNSIARLEQLSGELSVLPNDNYETNENNNEVYFDLNSFTKHKAIPIRINSTDGSLNFDGLAKHNDDDDEEDERASVVSSSSLRSSRTYHIRRGLKDYDERAAAAAAAAAAANQAPELHDGLNEAAREHAPGSYEEKNEARTLAPNEPVKLFDENNAKAWIFDINDCSSTAIDTPPKPESPKPAQVDSIDLATSRGGKSYYLEVVDSAVEEVAAGAACNPETRGASVDLANVAANRLNDRWSSQGHLNGAQKASGVRKSASRLQLAPKNQSKGNQIQPVSVGSSIKHYASRPNLTGASANLQQKAPQNGSALVNSRSKSSSCLATSTRPTKYSIYGGFKQSSDKKPVPRLSYSRAIGPKYQRQSDAQCRIAPSRYLKMK